MAKNGLYTGIDIGTNTIKVLVAEYVSGEMNIIGNGNAKAEGLSKGIIVDIEKTAMSIRKAVNAAQEKAGIVIDTVNVAIPANQLQIEPCQGMVQISGGSKEIMDNDVVEVVQNALMRGLVPEREIIAVEPTEFVVDGFSEISDPRGMLGVRLEMKGVLYTGPKTLIHNIITSIERAGFSVGNIVVSPLALSKRVLSEQEREFGTVMIDLGAGQTTVAAVKDDQIRYVNWRPEGGDYVTKDISDILNTSVKSAEDIKLNYAEASTERASREEFFLVDMVGKPDPEQVSEYYLSQIVEARVAQIFEKIRQDLETNRVDSFPGGVVLLGGAAAMPGIVDVASRVFEQNVKLYVPAEVGLRNPAYSQVISVVSYISGRSDIEVLVTRTVMGDVPAPSPVYEVPVASAIVQPVVSQSATEYYEEAVAPVTPLPQSHKSIEAEPEEKEGFVNRVRGILTNMFD
ncbi:cell division protein FtsA [Lactovum miscens]|uniref:Cell division protein FtsA n=1 Tax=Lactovum miscens TaxID=190387 RepID=A0A841C7S4_9LACT|nr:cell division protein FtsA [Lactovum miscens]MBB5888535.1 cell division protein FtsA [Lactovum miscens]